MSENTFPEMLRRLAARVTPATVIDVGASDARWSRMAMEFWPDARYLLIEADERHYPALDRFRKKHDVSVIKAMAGPVDGVCHFSADPSDPWGGQGHIASAPGSRECVAVSIDAALHVEEKRDVLIKLDTHGFEIPILQGAARTLQTACAVIIEAYTCTLQPGAVRFWELCQYMAFAGFTCTDMADPMRRPLDGRLWQFDLAFERSDAPMVGESRFK